MIGMIPRDQLFRNQNKYFVLRMLSRSRHNSVLIYFFTASKYCGSGLKKDLIVDVVLVVVVVVVVVVLVISPLSNLSAFDRFADPPP